VRQIRLRDLGGIIVIDFIDMDERATAKRFMQELELALQAIARLPGTAVQNDFGWSAITRKRVKQSLERTLARPASTAPTGPDQVRHHRRHEIYVEMAQNDEAP